MKTIVEALQDLYVALGGKKADVSGLKLNPDVIEQIAALVNEGALNELPAVTIEDAGDVLTVDNSGKWGKAAPSGGGGGGMIIATFSYDSEQETWSCDLTGAQIHSAMESGSVVYAQLDGEVFYIPMTMAAYSASDDFDFTFEYLQPIGQSGLIYAEGYYHIYYSSGNGVEVYGPEYSNTSSFAPSYIIYADSATFNYQPDQFIPDTIVLTSYEDIGIEWIPGTTRIQYSKNNGVYQFDALVVGKLADSFGNFIGLISMSTTPPGSGAGTKVSRYYFNESTMTLELEDIPE